MELQPASCQRWLSGLTFASLLLRPHQHQEEGCLAVRLPVRPARAGLCRLWDLPRRRPPPRVAVRPRAWHPRRNLQQLPGH